jgi:putative ABC transport system permease protein
LAIGIAACFLILLFVHYEMNWNDYYKNYNRIYRVQQKVLFKDHFSIDVQSGFQLAPELKNQVPEIENAATVLFLNSEYLSTSDNLTFQEKYGAYSDNNLFKVITFEFVQGNPETALTSPYCVVITEDMANKYFPGENAFGKTIKSGNNKSLLVTGIVKNLPYNLDFRPDYLVSMSTYRELADWKYYDKLENIGASIFHTLVLLKPNVSVQTVNDKIYNFSDKYVVGNFKKLYLKPFSDIHLTADETSDAKIALFYIGGFAIFVLVLACINFINLSTANSFLRKKEIGIRKVVGASRYALVVQFIGESLLYSSFAIIIAAVLVAALLPGFNTLIQRHIEINFTRDINFIMYMVATFLVTGFLSGVYPAIYLSGFQPSHIIKGNVSLLGRSKTGTSKSFLRKSLVTFQFCISVALLISTIFIVKQVNFMNTKELGFDDKNLLMCNIYGAKIEGKFETLKNELLANPDIVDATFSNNAPFFNSWGKEINWEGCAPLEKMSINYNSVDYDFIDTYKMRVVKGRYFSRQFSTDNNACVVNQTACKILNWKDPIGKKIDNNRYTIIGVVADFHQYSVHAKIPAYYMTLNSGNLKESGVFGIRVNTNNNEQAANYVKSCFKKFFPNAIIEVKPFGKDVNIGTKGVWEIVQNVFVAFTILAILISANGLFGMISFTTQRRTKEVGIRKVFGANLKQLYLMISKEFFYMLVVAAIVVYPAGYFISSTSPGAYKYQLQISDYLVCIGLMFFTAAIASFYHTTKAVLANPVNALKYE